MGESDEWVSVADSGVERVSGIESELVVAGSRGGLAARLVSGVD